MAPRKRIQTPKTVDDYRARPEEFQEAWIGVGQAVTRMREGASASQAAREVGINFQAFVRLAGSALKKDKKGRYVARPTDRLLRVIVIPTADGLIEIGIADSREASVAGSYLSSVQRYLQTGDAERLRSFEGHYIETASGEHIPLLTDLDELDRLGSAGVLSFESMYSKVG